MSKILSALEKACREETGSDQFLSASGIVALPSTTRSIRPKKNQLRAAGWFSALPRPPKQCRGYSALAEHILKQATPPARILVCAAAHRAGATSTSLNLATEMALSTAGNVNWCEIPRGDQGVRNLFGAACRHGLWDHMTRGIPLHEVRVTTHIPHLSLFPGIGWRTPDLAVPESHPMEHLLDYMLQRETVNYTVVDAPPATESRVTCSLAQTSDLVVLVVTAGMRHRELEYARKTLGEVRLGAVFLNQLPRWSLHTKPG